jgi:hypothetical protein
MKLIQFVFLLLLIGGLSLTNLPSNNLFAQDQEKGKGELEDFADDYDDEDSEGDSEAGDATQFFIIAFFENFGDFVRLWGRAPGTESGPYPSFPYDKSEGFMSDSNDYRSYYFNTEFTYHNLSPDPVRSFIFKWESQFVQRSKLSFDFSVYQEDRGLRTDYLSIYGLRYGYAVYRSPQFIVNLEGGFRGFQRNKAHGGVEVAIDAQLFPKRPLIIETEVAVAYVSNGPLYTVESSAGILLGRYEILGGMRLLKSKDTILDGFRVGLRVWY